MSDPTARVRSRWWGRSRLLVAAMVVVTAGTLVLVIDAALALGLLTIEVQAATRQSVDLSNATREILLLEQGVSEFGHQGVTAQELQLRVGLLGRQLRVAMGEFPDDSSAIHELRAIDADVRAFPWDRLVASDGADRELLAAADTLVTDNEKRLNRVSIRQEASFLAVTEAALSASRRSQLGLAGLVTVVLTVGSLGVAMVLRRNRTVQARANLVLQAEVNERRAAEEALRASEGRFRSLVQRGTDLTVVTDRAGVVSYVSPAAEALLGHPAAELQEHSLLDHVEPDQRPEVAETVGLLAAVPGLVQTIELRLRTRDERVRSVEAACQNLLNDPDVRGLVWNGRDVTDRRALQDELTRQAHHDPLTGLPNRLLLLTRLGEALRAPPSPATCVSVILIDLDGFKHVNDTLGHPAGDELLRATAQRLLGCLRAGDTAARLGGDEFAVLLSGPPEQAVAISRRIVEVVRRPCTVAGLDVRVGASVGVAHRTDRESAEDLLRDADIAMYVAKNNGKGRVEVFEQEMRSRASYRTALQQELARAVELGEIEVHYQPIIDLGTLRPTSVEALARWRRPDRSLAGADVFIPMAEESGAIAEIGREVLDQACRATSRWRRTRPGFADLSVAVNVSVHQVLSGLLVDHVVDALQNSGLPPTALTLEITESTAIENSARVSAEFARLQALGVRIAVDDFGAGYSSLGFLLGLDADSLKIDKTLLDFDTTRQGSLVAAIAELGRTLGLTVVVEGVETAQHLARARQASCDAAQGYHLSRPLPADAVAGYLSGWDRDGSTDTNAGVAGG